MSLRGVDLNLLVTLQAILEEASVTRGAERIGLTQSAASLALARGRDLFGDRLLVRQGNRMLRTPRAEGLHASLREALAGVEAVLAPPAFDPATARRRFVVSVSDYAETVALPGVMARLGAEAPQVALALRSLERHPVGAAAEDGAGIDLYLSGVDAPPAGFHHESLIEDDFVLIAARDHPILRGPLDADALCAWPHALVSPAGGAARGPVDAALDALGRRRHVALSLTRFGSLPGVLAAGRLLACVPCSVAGVLTGNGALASRAMPFAVPRAGQALIWHRRLDDDPAQLWLREVFRRAMRIAASRVCAG